MGSVEAVSPPPSRRTKGAVLAALSLATPLALVLGTAPARAAPPTVTITVDAAHPGRVIPRDFVGLSFEADQLHRTWTDPDRGNVAALLGNLGTGNLRFSANQVDNTAWMPDPGAPTPAWATDGQRIVPDDLSRVGRLAARTGWSVDLGVNLGHFDPAAAANEAAAATRRLGAGLRAIQIGNEPNVHVLQAPGGTRRPYDPQGYIRDARVYRQAIRAAAGAVRFDGPNTAAGAVGIPAIDNQLWPSMVAPWLTAYVQAFGKQSRTLNQHYYPFVNITRLGVPVAAARAAGALPTVDGLLSPDTRARQTKFLSQFTALAHRAGLRPQLAETNSVAREGREGVTNSFGAALWTVDYLMTAARLGVTGVNLHNQVDDCQSYPVFCFGSPAAKRSDTAQVNPNYYGTLMVHQMVGGAILPVTVDAGGASITAHAVRMGDGSVKVIVDNLDRAFRGRIVVNVAGGSAGDAEVARLTAPSPDALSGTRYAAATVTAAGGFTPRATERANRRSGRYRLPLTTPSALLMTVR